jgi:hypothetical protein
MMKGRSDVWKLCVCREALFRIHRSGFFARFLFLPFYFSRFGANLAAAG